MICKQSLFSLLLADVWNGGSKEAGEQWTNFQTEILQTGSYLDTASLAQTRPLSLIHPY